MDGVRRLSASSAGGDPRPPMRVAAAAWRRAGSDVVAGLDRDVTVRDVIMCHPPAVDSDLSFDAFFKQVFLAGAYFWRKLASP